MKRLTLLLGVILLVSCQNKVQIGAAYEGETSEIEDVTHNNVVVQSIEKNSDSLSSIILKENVLKLEFDTTNENLPDYFKIFDDALIKKYIAFADKTYPLRSNPKHYDHFVLYLVEFESEQDTKNIFDRLVKEQSEDIKTSNPFRLQVFAKYGGIITYKENYIITLVKTCRDTPNKMSWNDYENLFFNIIHHDTKDTSEYLYAKCGMMNFNLMNFKKSK